MLRLNSWVEAHLYSYLLDRFSGLKTGQEFKLCKSIAVGAPFGRTDKRDQDGLSCIRPEICLIGEMFGVVAEAAAWDDDAKNGNKQSEAHQAMHYIGIEKRSVYFAQKIICQVLPAYLYCKDKQGDVYAFISFTQNHKSKMERVLYHLASRQLIQSFYRPLKKNDKDIRKYKQVIYELRFPERPKDIINKVLADGGIVQNGRNSDRGHLST